MTPYIHAMDDQPEARRTTADIYLGLGKLIQSADNRETGNLLEALRQLTNDDRDAVRNLLIQTVTALALSDQKSPDLVLQELSVDCDFEDAEAWAEFCAEIEVFDLSKLYLVSAPEPTGDSES